MMRETLGDTLMCLCPARAPHLICARRDRMGNLARETTLCAPTTGGRQTAAIRRDVADSNDDAFSHTTGLGTSPSAHRLGRIELLDGYLLPARRPFAVLAFSRGNAHTQPGPLACQHRAWVELPAIAQDARAHGRQLLVAATALLINAQDESVAVCFLQRSELLLQWSGVQ